MLRRLYGLVILIGVLVQVRAFAGEQPAVPQDRQAAPAAGAVSPLAPPAGSGQQPNAPVPQPQPKQAPPAVDCRIENC